METQLEEAFPVQIDVAVEERLDYRLPRRVFRVGCGGQSLL